MFMSKAAAALSTTLSHKPSCTTAIAIREQARFLSSGVFIPEADISAESLQKLLAKFKVESTIDEDGELLVDEAFGPVVYIRIEPKRHWIVFHTGFPTPALDDEDRTAFADYLSNDLAMAQFAATEGGIGMGYFMYYRGGLSVDQFMAMAQRFGSLAWAALRRYTTYELRVGDDRDSREASVTLN
jgi:hypothetical protein